MKHVFTATTMSADQEIVKGLLDEAAIPCMIPNEHLSMALGELAPSECSPENLDSSGFLVTRTIRKPRDSGRFARCQC